LLAETVRARLAELERNDPRISYACMLRPWVPPVKTPPAEPRERFVQGDDEGLNWKTV
jgi:hypothetical protein